MRFAWSVVLLASCAAPVRAPVAPPAPVRVAATLTVETGEEPPRPEGVPAVAPGPTSDELLADLRSTAARDAALAITGQPRSSELAVREDGRMAELSITAPTAEGAIALCRAWVRGATERTQPATTHDYLDGERQRLERSLTALTRSRQLLPTSIGPAGPRETALVAVRVLRLAADTGQAPMLVALARLLAEARSLDADHERRGLGEAHPERQAARARVEALMSAVKSQRAVERAELAAAEALVLGLKPRAAADETARAFGARLEKLGIERVSSVEPRELQDLAITRVELVAERAALSLRLGEGHPRQRELYERLWQVDATFASERVMASQFLLHGAAVPVDKPDEAIDEKARRLAIVLARLDTWAAARRPARVVVVAPCHGVSP